jgi:hypothetical protein
MRDTSTPLVRIGGDIDSIDHITDFESAADLTMTLWKFQEFELPVSMPQKRPENASHGRVLGRAVSVFEDGVDNIVERKKGGDNTTGVVRRWKFGGPWLAGEDERDFRIYVKKRISGRKVEFRGFLRERLAEKERRMRRESARDDGTDLPESPVEISDQTVDDYIRVLRRKPADLRPLVENFLDLPRTVAVAGDAGHESGRNYALSGPPTTHPSAGLSYLRTGSRMFNHPILGPQAEKPPIQGRFLVPHTNAQGHKRPRALVGIGGMVADDSRSRYGNKDQQRGITRFDPHIPGGAKHWFHPQHATVHPTGRVKLHIQRAQPYIVTLHHGESGGQTHDPAEKTHPPFMNDDRGSRSFQVSSETWRHRRSSPLPSRGYGLVDQSTTTTTTPPVQARSSGRVRPLDLNRSNGLEEDENVSQMLKLSGGGGSNRYRS